MNAVNANSSDEVVALAEWYIGRLNLFTYSIVVSVSVATGNAEVRIS